MIQACTPVIILAFLTIVTARSAVARSPRHDTKKGSPVLRGGRRMIDEILYCNSIGCPDNFTPVDEAWDVACEGGSCEVDMCCQALCAGFACPSGEVPIEEVKYDICDDNLCSEEQCCEGGGGNSDGEDDYGDGEDGDSGREDGYGDAEDGDSGGEDGYGNGEDGDSGGEDGYSGDGEDVYDSCSSISCPSDTHRLIDDADNTVCKVIGMTIIPDPIFPYIIYNNDDDSDASFSSYYYGDDDDVAGFSFSYLYDDDMFYDDEMFYDDDTARGDSDYYCDIETCCVEM